MILKGKKTLLYPMTDKDFDYFFEIYQQHDPSKMAAFNYIQGGNLGITQWITNAVNNRQMAIWVGYTKEGKATRKVGIIYAVYVNPTTVSIHGIVDTKFLKGLAVQLRKKDRLTYTEDSLNTVLDYFLSNGTNRVETTIDKDNRLAIQLARKCGMKKEGVLRKILKVDDHFYDMVVLSKLKEN